MGSDSRYGGITRSGTEASYSYTAKDDFANKPVTYVSWHDAARFCNWLHNGQPSGPRANTETGAYNMSSVDPVRNPEALYYLPVWDEWYKAAYHDPRAESGGGPPGDDHYWRYPTRSDSAPASVPPPGGTNSANMARNGDNLTLSPWGDLLICEDTANHCGIVGVRPDGTQYAVADNAYTTAELAGVCFSPDGSTMFVNVQQRGMTLAITGPWSVPA